MELFGIDLYDSKDLVKLLFKFSIDLLFLFIIVRVIYYRIKEEKDYVFTFFMFNILTFFICFLLRKVPMEMGFALGLFAVFGILRYRTEAIPIRQMTYLFIVIGISMIKALGDLCYEVLEPLRAHFSKPVTITSGYRSEALCEAIGSKKTSQHAKGQAVDLEIFGVPNI